MLPSLCPELSAAERDDLLEIARRSIHEGLNAARPLHTDLANCGETLRMTPT